MFFCQQCLQALFNTNSIFSMSAILHDWILPVFVSGHLMGLGVLYMYLIKNGFLVKFCHIHTIKTSTFYYLLSET